MSRQPSRDGGAAAPPLGVPILRRYTGVPWRPPQRARTVDEAMHTDLPYAMPRAPVEAALAAGRDVAFDIDWQGYRQLRGALPGDVVGLFILPPSRAALHARLLGRGDPPEAAAARRRQANDEISHAGEFHHVLVNDDFDIALAQTRAVLQAARLATGRQVGLARFVAGLGQ